ncbi:hypothetical protein GCM10009000_057660 [Halobacterium noricense]|uniref:Uncharacterized protein n=1 Tax=Haladaptatus pallidirubidus TaxID=1008152 RepID=A0AAV3UJX7_9EURY
MFLLKGVAGRDYDPDDMMIRTDISFETVREKCSRAELLAMRWRHELGHGNGKPTDSDVSKSIQR